MGKRTTKSVKRAGLTAQQRLFAHFAAQPGVSAAAAYRESYPNAMPSTAETCGPALLRKPQVAKYVEQQRQKLLGKVDSKAQEVLDELRHVGLARLSRVVKDDGTVVPLSKWDEHEKAALTKLAVERDFLRGANSRQVTDDGVEVGPTPASETVFVEMKGKLEALGLLAKVHKLITEKVEHDHKGTVLVVDPYAVPAAGASDARTSPPARAATAVRQADGGRAAAKGAAR